VSTKCAWDGIVGQERAIELLRNALELDRVSHAYLFVGPRGSGKKTAARAFACALICDDAGCGACVACSRIKRGLHPDVRIIRPEGAAGYLVEQVRDGIVHDVSLTPVESSRKIYILEQAERLNAASANAMLRTLEEPPDDVVIMLLAEDTDAVLPTIISRCQVIRFERVPFALAVATVVEKTSASEADAMAAMAAAGGVPARAIDFIQDHGRRDLRAGFLRTLHNLTVMDAHDVLHSVDALLKAAKLPLESVRAGQADEIQRRSDFLGRDTTGLRATEDRHKRELTAAEREVLVESFNVVESWLRDCLVVSQGASDLVLNRDAADETEAIGTVMTPRAALRALASVNDARARVAANVAPQLAFEAMLLDIQEVLTCPR